MKTCRKCRISKHESDFRTTYIKTKYYLRSECKKCQNKRRNQQRQSNGKVKLNEHRRDYYKRNSQRMNRQRIARRKVITRSNKKCKMKNKKDWVALLTVAEMPKTKEGEDRLVEWLRRVAKEIKGSDPHKYAKPCWFRLMK